MLGPFYEPGAPVRTSVGSGYELSGAVLAAEECKPIPNAKIEFWLANSRGDYDDAHRATVFASERGRYRLESNVPVSYGGRPPHIHVRVRAPGYEELVTQHYPQRGQRKANFDLVLVGE
jgi:protocatechuate 3,4-dioxygenase beta subunit